MGEADRSQNRDRLIVTGRPRSLGSHPEPDAEWQ